jgi:HPt (histidine-containing phosphotransfer) domain-containing protein
LSARQGDRGDAALAALYEAYARRLPERLAQLVADLEAWRQTPERADLLEEITSLAHRLRGSAGSYGFPSFSGAMGAVEDSLRRVRLTGGTHANHLEAVDQALCRARALADEAVAKISATDDSL